MPVEMGVWNIDEEPQEITFSAMGQESRLEDVLEQHIEIIDPELMVIDRQIRTKYGQFIDLLAIDAEGTLVLIELKRDKTPRDVVAQLLDYASWVSQLSYDKLADIWASKAACSSQPVNSFEDAFAEKFHINPPDASELIGRRHRLLVVAAELDDSTERIIDYLSEMHGVPVNAVFFRYYCDKGSEYLCRSWLVEPTRAEERSGGNSIPKEPWNGHDFYISLGEFPARNWDDCRRYGFVCAGGGAWYSRTLYQLQVGNRVFVNIPRTGYVGVGIVTQEAVPISEFQVEVDGEAHPIFDVPLVAPEMGHDIDDLELCEHMVGVRWLHAVPREEAVWKTGMFANQNSACRLRSSFTIDTVLERFDLR